MLNKFYISVLALFCLLAANAAPRAYAQDKAPPQSAAQMQLSFAPIVKQTAPAVVNIYTSRTVSQSFNPFAADPFFTPLFREGLFGNQMRSQVENSLGSGVIVRADGLVVTNAHVAGNADEINVVLADGREFPASISLVDKASDLALLRIDSQGEALPYLSLKPSETLEVGDIVLAIGNPFGVGQTVTSGIISAQGRSSLDINDFNFFIQTDAAINPGNSGGPLVALDGGVVGINAAIFSRDGGSLGIGFAIPSEMVASVIAAEEAGLSSAQNIVRPWLGVSAQSVTADMIAALDLPHPQGALISALHPSSPLKRAGLKVGDVITAINDHTLRDAAEMKFRMATVPLGDEAAITYKRQGQTLESRIEAIAPPDDPPRQETAMTKPGPLQGASFARLNPAVAYELGLESEEEEGVIVLSVEPESPAARLVKTGEIILAVNGREIESPSDIQAALSAGRGQGLSLVKNSFGRIQRLMLR